MGVLYTFESQTRSPRAGVDSSAVAQKPKNKSPSQAKGPGLIIKKCRFDCDAKAIAHAKTLKGCALVLVYEGGGNFHIIWTKP